MKSKTLDPQPACQQTIQMTTPIRCLHLLGRLSRGGIEMWLMNLLRLRDSRLHFDFAVRLQGVFDEEVRESGCTLHRLPPSRSFRAWQRALEKILDSQRYDVVHCHGIEFAGDALKIARAAGVPARIAHAHNTGWCRGKKGVIMELRKLRFAAIGRRRALKHATHVLGCSNDAGRFYFGKHWGDPNTQALYYGIPLESYDVDRTADSRRDLCARYGIPEGSIVVGHVGSLTRPKNQIFLLEIFREIASRDERYVLFIAGDGELRPRLESIVRQHGLERRVVMPGGCDCIPELMTQLFDVFALPSVFEGLGLVLIEAAAAGLHCICSEVIPADCVNAIAGRVQAIPLAASPCIWADAVVAGVGSRLAPRAGCEIIRNTDFDRKKSLEALIGVYRAAIA